MEQSVPVSHIIMIELDQRKNKKYREGREIMIGAGHIFFTINQHSTLDSANNKCYITDRTKEGKKITGITFRNYL